MAIRRPGMLWPLAMAGLACALIGGLFRAPVGTRDVPPSPLTVGRAYNTIRQLPAGAQGSLSAGVGAADLAYHVTPSRRGYLATNGSGGVKTPVS